MNFVIDPDNLITEAKSKQLTEKQYQESMAELKKGNTEMITALVDDYELIIVRMALKIVSQQEISIDMLPLLIDKAKQKLITLAKNEINSTTREGFSRFGVWVINQTFLKEISALNSCE